MNVSSRLEFNLKMFVRAVQMQESGQLKQAACLLEVLFGYVPAESEIFACLRHKQNSEALKVLNQRPSQILEAGKPASANSPSFQRSSQVLGQMHEDLLL